MLTWKAMNQQIWQQKRSIWRHAFQNSKSKQTMDRKSRRKSRIIQTRCGKSVVLQIPDLNIQRNSTGDKINPNQEEFFKSIKAVTVNNNLAYFQSNLGEISQTCRLCQLKPEALIHLIYPPPRYYRK